MHTHWAERAEADAGTIAVICECGLEACVETIHVTRGDYEAVRAHPARFIVVDGHEIPDVERAVERTPCYLVVEKTGGSRAYVEHLDPRSR